jgi:hypothetical protein
LQAALPASLQAVLAGKPNDPISVLRVVSDLLIGSGELDQAASDAIAELFPADEASRKAAGARRKKVTSPDGIADFVEPMLTELMLRDKIQISAGHVHGVGLPMLPWIPPSPVVLTVNANIYSRKAEQYLQINSPRYAVEFTVGETTGTSHDIKAGAGWGHHAGIARFAAPMGTLSAGYEKSGTASTSVRILREKDPQTRQHKEQEAITEAKDVLQDLIHWPDRRTGDDQAFAGPLEALLARHPKILVASADKKTTKASVGAKLEARARVNIGHPKARLVAGLNIGWKSDRTKESAVERTGYEHQKVVDVSDQATHRATVEGNLGLATKGLSQDVAEDDEGKGRWHGPNLIGAGMTVELANIVQKHGMTFFPISDQTGGTIDRIYSTPKDLLAEIAQNREAWLQRCIDTLPPPGAGENQAAVQTKAENMLQRFEADLGNAKHDPTVQYNIKYEMQPLSSGWLDACSAIEVLAAKAGDDRGAAAAREAAQQLLQSPANWSPKNMTVRRKVKETRHTGLNFVARIQKSAGSEAQRADMAFPG